jgi:hypothetical protein
VFQPTTTQQVGVRTAHVDYLLSFVIGRSLAHDGTGVGARLDALEETLVSLTRPWRDGAALAPARELRVSSETLASLLAWLEQGGDADRSAIERLGVYASGAVTDRAVPHGWVRIQLA